MSLPSGPSKWILRILRTLRDCGGQLHYHALDAWDAVRHTSTTLVYHIKHAIQQDILNNEDCGNLVEFRSVRTTHR